MKLEYTVEDELALLKRILSRIYVARNITLSGETIELNLKLLDTYHNALCNDHNGEYSDEDMAVQRILFFNKIQEALEAPPKREKPVPPPLRTVHEDWWPPKKQVFDTPGVVVDKKHYPGGYYDREYWEYLDRDGNVLKTVYGGYN